MSWTKEETRGTAPRTWTAAEQAANREKWVEALRSGEYEQGKGALRVYTDGEDAFCCLGVACDLAVRSGEGNWSGGYFYSVSGDPGNFQVLPKSIQDWLGLTNDSAILGTPLEYGTEGGHAWLLTELNDHVGYSFAQIADLIESGGVKVQ